MDQDSNTSKRKVKSVIIAQCIVALLLAAFLHHTQSKYQKLKGELAKAYLIQDDKDASHLMIVKKYENGVTDYRQQIEILSRQNAELENKLIKVSGLKRPDAQIRWKTKIEIVNQPLVPDTGAGKVASSLYRRWISSNEHYTIRAHTDSTGRPTIDSLKIKCDWQVTTGMERTGFLGLAKKPVLSITTTNPYVPITDLQAIKIDAKPAFILRPGVVISIGILTGILVAKF